MPHLITLTSIMSGAFVTAFTVFGFTGTTARAGQPDPGILSTPEPRAQGGTHTAQGPSHTPDNTLSYTLVLKGLPIDTLDSGTSELPGAPHVQKFNVPIEQSSQLHFVRKGETIRSLAEQACTSVQTIQNMNALNNDVDIHATQILILPGSKC